MAASRRRQRVLDHVHLQRYRAQRPAARRMRKAEVHWHEEAMLDRDLVAKREIELVLVDERFRQMRGELEIALHLGQRSCAEALVADGIALGDAEGEGWVLVEAEVGGVVVVDDD